MLDSRRQRCKKEGTFLEYVKEAIVSLTAEISEVKSMLVEIKTFSNVSCEDGSTFHSVFWPSEDWYTGTWHQLGFDNGSGVSRTEVPCYLPGAFPSSTYSDFPATLDRERLLSFRQVSDCFNTTLETSAALLPTQGCQEKPIDEELIGELFLRERSSTGDQRLLWMPGSKSFIRAGSVTHEELLEEAAIRIQKWFRRDAEVSASDDSDQDEDRISRRIAGAQSMAERRVLDKDVPRYAKYKVTHLRDKTSCNLKDLDNRMQTYLSEILARIDSIPKQKQNVFIFKSIRGLAIRNNIPQKALQQAYDYLEVKLQVNFQDVLPFSCTDCSEVFEIMQDICPGCGSSDIFDIRLWLTDRTNSEASEDGDSSILDYDLEEESDASMVYDHGWM
jgi:hypothetical protein